MPLVHGTENSHMQPLLNRSAAAEYLGIKPETLAVWACTKRYPLAYVKVGRHVRYRQTDLDAFIAANMVQTERGRCDD